MAQPAPSPTGTHLSTAIDAARASTPAGDPAVATQPPAGAPGASPRSKGPKEVLAIPDPEPAGAAATPESAPPTATGGGSQPATLTGWAGTGPPLPAAFVYFAVFASGLAIVVSMRRELGLHTRRRRRF